VVAVALVLTRHARVLLVLALACGKADRNASSTQSGTPSSATIAGPKALALRVPKAAAGGMPRVFSYPGLDSLVWSSTEIAPTPAHMLAFDDESGSVAYEDTKSRPVLLELRVGTVTVYTAKKLTGLASANGSAIFGIASNGDVVRVTPAGDWTYKPPLPARAVFPQQDGGLLVSFGRGAATRILKLFPPDKRVIDSIPFPVATQTVRTQLGDRLYLAVDSGLVVLRTRTMDWAPAIHLDEPIAVMASTPSGDRIFVLSESGKQISIVDRFRDRVTGVLALPARASDLRVDPFGRYLLARAAEGDSMWVAAIGTQRLIGGLRSAWRPDLPFVGYDGSVAVTSGTDVVLYDGETLRPRARVRGGAQDYWYPFTWDGFRPRAASLDEPVRFDSVIVDTAVADSIPPVTPVDTGASVPDSADAARGFYVQFAAYLASDRARELAARIHVGGEDARVVTSTRDGSTIYRVVLGPFLTKDEAERAGRESKHSYWVYEGLP
jgi:hypothetical protein